MAADGGFDMSSELPDIAADAADAAGRAFIETVARLARSDPAKAKTVIAEVMGKASTIDGFATIALGSGHAPASALTLDVAGAGVLSQAEADRDELGRNQRSRIREAVLLDILQANAGPCALTKLMAGLAGRGIADTQAAVVSHLHRLKANGLITQPGNGFYDITSDGLGHLRKLRASLGPLVP